VSLLKTGKPDLRTHPPKPSPWGRCPVKLCAAPPSQFNAYLTIGLLTDSPAILMSYSYRILALFEPAGFVNNPGLNGFEVRHHLTEFDSQARHSCHLRPLDGGWQTESDAGRLPTETIPSFLGPPHDALGQGQRPTTRRGTLPRAAHAQSTPNVRQLGRSLKHRCRSGWSPS
jgi:hypothetical protein